MEQCIHGENASRLTSLKGPIQRLSQCWPQGWLRISQQVYQYIFFISAHDSLSCLGVPAQADLRHGTMEISRQIYFSREQSCVWSQVL